MAVICLKWQMIGRVVTAGSNDAKVTDSKLKEALEKRSEVFSLALGHMPIKTHFRLKEGTRPVAREA